jgi:TonB family protein
MKNTSFIFLILFLFTNLIHAQLNVAYLNRALNEEARFVYKNNNIRGFADYHYEMTNGVRNDTVRKFSLVQIDSSGNIASIAEFDGARNFLTQRKYIYNQKNERIAEFFIDKGQLKYKILYYYDLDNELIESVNLTDFGSVNERIRFYRNSKGLIKDLDAKGPTGTEKFKAQIKYNTLNYPEEIILTENDNTVFTYTYSYDNKNLKSESIHITGPETKSLKEYYSENELVDSIYSTNEKDDQLMIVRKHFTFGQSKRNIEKWLVIPDFNKYFKAENEIIEQFSYKTAPQFPGGKEALKRYIKEELKYPKKALKSGIDGLVIVQFVIDPSGGTGNYRIVKSVDYELDNAAIDLVKKMPQWKPALNEDGKETISSYNLPVNFVIE